MEKKEINININKIAYWMAIVLVMAIAILFVYETHIQLFSKAVIPENDNYVMITHGRYAMEHGFPVIEPFSMHENWDFLMSDWLTEVLVAFVYDNFGLLALYCVFIVFFIIKIVFVYKTALLVSKRPTASLISTCIFFACASSSFTTRAQVITTAFVAIELYCLEKFYLDNNWKYLIPLPFLSVLVINFHNPIWIILYITMGPYIVETLCAKEYKKYVSLFITAAVMFLTALINPYGIDAITYIVKSLGALNGLTLVSELASPSFSNAGFTFTMLIFGMFILMLVKHHKLQIRFLFFFFGFMFLGFIAMRNVEFFFIIAFILLPIYMPSLSENGGELKVNKRLVSVFVLCVLGMAMFGTFISSYKNRTIPEEDKYVSYAACDYIADNYDPDIAVFNSINDGGYLIFKGYKPYVDARLEVYSDKLNGKENVISDVSNLQNHNLDFEEYMQAHPEFDVFLVNKRIYDSFAIWLTTRDDLKIVYEDNTAYVFERIR